MPDRRTHRGPHPDDAVDFAPASRPQLLAAVEHLSWLFSRGYADRSALKLVGDRFNLTERQRMAVRRSACSDESLARRHAHQVGIEAVGGRPVLLDGYNVLTTVEAALAGGVVLSARDGCFRDLASMHGTFRQVSETVPAAELIGTVLAELAANPVTWYLDRPVSNSGRLKTSILDTAACHEWPWQVEVVVSPDKVLAAAEGIVATADSVILDLCGAWLNLAREVITCKVPDARIIPMGSAG